jgi:hypothetical protein
VPAVYDCSVPRLLAWTAGVVGIAALGRVLARNRRRHARAPATAPVEDRAEALRRKLSETRAAEAGGGAAPVSVPTAETADAAPEPMASDVPTETIEERRARVHAKAQEVIDAMHEALE